MIYEMCRKFAEEELMPNAGKWDKNHEFPTEAVDKLVSGCGMIRTPIKFKIAVRNMIFISWIPPWDKLNLLNWWYPC